jgi:DNA repair exonuclease SbcCD ATPase subunit
MRVINFKSLKISNFMSVGNDPIEITFKEGLNQIDGFNLDNPERKNAVGKSVIINSFFFALFGETVNKIKNEFLPNFNSKGKSIIELHFDVKTNNWEKSYSIRRQVKPSKVELFEGDTDITRDSIANTNRYICDLIQSNPTIHKCCDLMTIRETIPFMEMDSSDKRKFIEDIFSIDVFSSMMKDLKKLISENKSDMNISSGKLEEIRTSLGSLLEQKTKVEEHAKQRNDILKTKKDQINNKLNLLEKEIKSIKVKDLNQLKLDQDKFNKALDKVDNIINSERINISNFTLHIKEYQNFLKECDHIKFGDTCNKCHQDIPNTPEYLDNKRKDISQLLSIYVKNNENSQNTLNEYLDKKVKIKNKLQSIINDVSQTKIDINKLDSLKNNKKELQDQLKSIEVDLNYVVESVDTFTDSISKMKIRESEQELMFTNFKEKSADYDICKFILGEDGVKSFAIKKLLLLLNNSIENYLIKLGMNVRCKFDEYFDEVITTSNGKVFSYKNASGAEKKTLDFACALSFADMRRKINRVYSNLVFYDEVFDNALDEKGLDLIMKVVKERINANKLSIYVISHRKEMKNHIDGDTIELVKIKGVTKIKS